MKVSKWWQQFSFLSELRQWTTVYYFEDELLIWLLTLSSHTLSSQQCLRTPAGWIKSHSLVQVVVQNISVTCWVTRLILVQKLYPPTPILSPERSPESAVRFRPHLANKNPLVPFDPGNWVDHNGGRGFQFEKLALSLKWKYMKTQKVFSISFFDSGEGRGYKQHLE